MIKNGATYFKWLVILVIFTFLFLTFRGCGRGSKISPPKTDTLRLKVDTMWEKSKTDTLYQPRPYAVYTPKPIYIETEIHDTLEAGMPDSLLNVHLKEYISYKYYSDTIKTAYGYLVIIDTVNKNRIISRRSISQFNVPTIEKIITLREPKRVVLYAGADLVGNKVTPLWGAGINLSLKFKNDKIWKVGAMLNKTGETMYSFGAQIPIRLRKQ